MLTPRAAASLSTHLQRRALTYLEVCRNLEEAATAAKNLRQHIGREDGSRSGSTLIALGVALIVFPDPTISDALGTALIALGLLKRKMRKIGVRDVYHEIHQIMRSIKEINE